MRTRRATDRDQTRETPGTPARAAGTTSTVQRAGAARGRVSPDEALALQRAVGNTVLDRMIGPGGQEHAGHGHTDEAGVSVQRAPASTHSQHSTHSATPSVQFEESMGANPMLYTDFNENYWVGNHHPPEGYVHIEQFCAYMATYWLTNGRPAGGLRFLDFPEEVRQHAVSTVRGWASSGGEAAQVTYAASQIGGHQVSHQQIVADVDARSLPVGTLLWFGDDRHAEAAAVVTKDHQFRMYDPNTGQTQIRDANGFKAYIATKNAFVVRVAPGADKESCACCRVM